MSQDKKTKVGIILLCSPILLMWRKKREKREMRGEWKTVALIFVGAVMLISSMVLPTTSVWMEGGMGPHGNVQG